MKNGIRNRELTVAFLMNAPTDPLNLIAFTSVFNCRQAEGKSAYKTIILSLDAEQALAGTGGLLRANSIPYVEYAQRIDTLVILGGEAKPQPIRPEVAGWIRKQTLHARRTVCVGAGVFMLAATGLLDGKRVTTHWHHVDTLAKAFPSIRVERNPIFVTDGKIYSTAGVSAGIDTALALVEEDYGHVAAASAARDLIVYMRRSGGEAQFSTILAQQAHVGGTPMRELPAWTKTRIAQKLNIRTLAGVVAMTPRTFARQFEAYFQTTPARWLQSLRIEAACDLIEGGQVPLKAIAGLTGFRDEQALRRAFVQQLALTPKQYRERCGAANHAGLQSKPRRLRGLSGVSRSGSGVEET